LRSVCLIVSAAAIFRDEDIC